MAIDIIQKHLHGAYDNSFIKWITRFETQDMNT